MRLSILLAATLALGAVAVPSAMATPADCAEGGPTISGPSTVYIVVGQSIADHSYTTDCDEPTAWNVFGDLPSGVTFDSAAARFVGIPTDFGGGFEIAATGSHGDGMFVGEFRQVHTELTITGTGGSDIDPAALEVGSDFALRGSDNPVGTTLEALWDGETALGIFVEESFTIEAAVPGDAERGAHVVDVVFSYTNGQRYVTRLAVTVTNLELSGPSSIFPIVGANTEYRYAGLDAGPDAVYAVYGQLPPGMALDSATGTISGAPESATDGITVVSMSVQDGIRSDGMEISVDVRSAAAVEFPAFMTPPQLGFQLAEIVELLPGLGSAGDSPTQEDLDALIDTINQDAQRDDKTPELLVGVDPETGESTFYLGSGLEGLKEQNEKLIEKATSEAEKAKQAAIEALEAERKHKQDAERLKQELLKNQNSELQKKLKEQLESQKAEKEKLAAAAKAKAEQELAKKLQMEDARKAFEARRLELENRTEKYPLPEGTVVQGELHSTPVLLGRATVGASGGFIIRTHIPTGTALGAHHLVVTYTLPDGTVYTQAVAVKVIAAPVVETPGIDPSQLAATGANLTPIGYMGIGSLLLGLAAILVRRRLSKPAASSAVRG